MPDEACGKELAMCGLESWTAHCIRLSFKGNPSTWISYRALIGSLLNTSRLVSLISSSMGTLFLSLQLDGELRWRRQAPFWSPAWRKWTTTASIHPPLTSCLNGEGWHHMILFTSALTMNHDNYTYSFQVWQREERTNYCKQKTFIEKVDFFSWVQRELHWKPMWAGLLCRQGDWKGKND